VCRHSRDRLGFSDLSLDVELLAMRPTGRSPQSEGIGSGHEYLTTHPAEAREMVRAAALAVETHYNWAEREEFLLGLYREVCVLPLPVPT